MNKVIELLQDNIHDNKTMIIDLFNELVKYDKDKQREYLAEVEELQAFNSEIYKAIRILKEGEFNNDD